MTTIMIMMMMMIALTGKVINVGRKVVCECACVCMCVCVCRSPDLVYQSTHINHHNVQIMKSF